MNRNIARRWHTACAVALAMTVAAPFVAEAAVPALLNVQGVVRTAAGEPVDGTFPVTFAVFDAASGGTELWNELQTDVPIDIGVFSALLGSDADNALPVAQLADAPELWLEVQVGSDLPLPRQRLVASAYAFQASHAVLAEQAVDLQCTGCVAEGELAFDPATQSELDAFMADPLAGLSCAEGNILVFASGAWACTADYVSPAELAAFDGRVTTLETAMAAVQGDVAALQTSVAGLENDVTGLQGDMAVVQGDVAALQAVVTGLESDVSTLQGDFASLDGQVSTLQTTVMGLESDVSTLQSDFADLDGQVSTLQTTVMGLESDVSTLQSDFADLDSQVSTLRTTVMGLESDVSTLQDGFASLDGQVSALQTTVTGLESDVSTLQTSVAGHDSWLGALQTTVNGLEGDVSTLQTSVAGHDGWLGALQSTVNGLEGDLHTLDTAFDAHAANPSAHHARYSDTEARAAVGQSLGRTTCGSGQALTYNGTTWVCADLAASGHNHDAVYVNEGQTNSITSDMVVDGTLVNGDISASAAIAPSKIAGTAATLTGNQSFDSGTLYIDAAANRVGVGTTGPTQTLDVNGNLRVRGSIIVDNHDEHIEYDSGWYAFPKKHEEIIDFGTTSFDFVTAMVRLYHQNGGVLTLLPLGSASSSYAPAYNRLTGSQVQSMAWEYLANLNAIADTAGLQFEGGMLRLVAVQAPATAGRYDSGWFACTASQTYSLTHGLGSLPTVAMIEVAENADGSGWRVPTMTGNNHDGTYWRQTALVNLTATQAWIRTQYRLTSFRNTEAGTVVSPTSGYCRAQLFTWAADYDSGWVSIANTTIATRDEWFKHDLGKLPSFAMVWLRGENAGVPFVIPAMGAYVRSGTIGTTLYALDEKWATIKGGSSKLAEFYDQGGTSRSPDVAEVRLLLWR